jgi:alkylated DNA nucleotide flippase Atl1
MKVLKLFIKQSDRQMAESFSLDFLRGYGIQGDDNASAGNPRQILMVDQPTLQEFGLQPGDLSENILVDRRVDQLVSGQILQIGSALIRPTFLCEPCAKLDFLRRGLAKQIRGRRGFLGMVVKSGSVTVGDAIVPTSHAFAELSDIAKNRFQEFVARIPSGKVVTTSDLVLALGVTDSHCRVIPTLIKTAPAHLPVHRIVAVNGRLFAQHMPDQADRLSKEGIEVVSNGAIVSVPPHYRWNPEHFHDLGNFET